MAERGSAACLRHIVRVAVVLMAGPLVFAHSYNPSSSNDHNVLLSILSANASERFAGREQDGFLQYKFGPTTLPLAAFEQERSFLGNASRLRFGAQDDAVTCRVYFEGPTSRPPTLSVESSSTGRGPFLVVFRDTHPAARGWIHGYERTVSPGHTGPFGAGDGEYVRVHPPSGVHVYEMLIFDGNYQLGPRLTAMKGTEWNNSERALGPEDNITDDVASALPTGSPRPTIVGRCSVSVSHAEIEAEEHRGERITA
ncbi:hypothetical protein CSUI_000584 [Cystoisospora suis]|uniref:Uncharacterized protein n=1 Tax=Cystoisospora suis TaxID=483139 RepID=A0A2C6LFJ9_9APIC|nr:hypothetical protein CSUI_000584 [Cystoisospora suis]